MSLHHAPPPRLATLTPAERRAQQLHRRFAVVEVPARRVAWRHGKRIEVWYRVKERLDLGLVARSAWVRRQNARRMR